MKRIISLILSIALGAAMLPAAFAANEDLIFHDARSTFPDEFANSSIVDAQAFYEDRIAALTKDGNLWIYNAEYGTFKKEAEHVVAFDGNSYALAYIKEDGSLWVDDENIKPAEGVISETENGYKKIMENAVSLNYSHRIGLVVDKNGKAWFWGSEVAEVWVPFEYEDVPNGYTETGIWGTEVVKPYNFMDDVKQISFYGSSTLILKTDGTLYSVGDNVNCALGIGNEDQTYRAKELCYVTDNVEEIICNSLHRFVIKTDGSLWGWGIERPDADGYNSSVPIKLAENIIDAADFNQSLAYVYADGKFTFDDPYYALDIQGVKSVQSDTNAMLVILENGTLIEIDGEVGAPEGEFAYADVILLAGPDWSMDDANDPAQGDIPPAASAIAQPTASKVLVNGKEVAFDAYNINSNNYFKLRDIAFKLSGTGNGISC